MSTQVQNGMVAFTAGEALAAYRRVKRSSGSGSSVVYADANEACIGVTQAAAASGESVTVRLLSDAGTFKVTAAGAFSVGDKLFPAADGKVDDDNTAGGPAEFVALEAASGDASIIEALPTGSSPSGSRLAFAAAAASSEVENTITETAFDVSKTIDEADLEVGDVLEVLATVYVLDNNSTDTLAIKLKVGTEEIVAPAAFDAADGDFVQIHAFINILATGASGSVKAHGWHNTGVPGTAIPIPFVKTAATEDISAGAAITLTATWSVAHADNECYLADLTVIHHRQ